MSISGLFQYRNETMWSDIYFLTDIGVRGVDIRIRGVNIGIKCVISE
jgi:hypothetical protein